MEWCEHLGTASGSVWLESREPGKEKLEQGQVFCAKLGSLNFISKATGSHGSQGWTGPVAGGGLMEPRLWGEAGWEGVAVTKGRGP